MLTFPQAGRRKGCDTRTIRNAVADGRLKATRKGLVAEADVDALELKPAGRKRAAVVEAEERAAVERALKSAAPTADPGEEKERPLTPAERMKQIDLERKEQEWARDRGLLLERAEAVRILADFGHHIRRELQSHPRKMQAAMVRHIRCAKCGAGVEAKIIAIEAERYVAQLLRLLADNPLGSP